MSTCNLLKVLKYYCQTISKLMKKNIFIWLLIFVFINTAYAQSKEDKTKGLKKISQDRGEVTNLSELSSLTELSNICDLTELTNLGVEIGLSVIQDLDLSHLSRLEYDLNVDLSDLDIDLDDLHLTIRDLREEIMDIDLNFDFEPMVRDLNELSDKSKRKRIRKPEQ